MRREDLADADCGIAQALGVLGDWWTVLILREVVGGTTTFDGVQRELGVSRRALAERLGILVEQGLLEKHRYCDRPPRHDYLLTERGEGVLPVLVALQEFGDRHLLGDGGLTALTDGASEMSRLAALTGTRVADVGLTDHTGAPASLRPTGCWRVAYFFPGAYAPGSTAYPPGWDRVPGAAGCTLESLSYARHHDAFVRAGADVVGVSTQRCDEQAAFVRHSGLPFRLLSDTGAKVGAALRLPLLRVAGIDRYKRHSLLLDDAGVVRHVQPAITDPAGSVTEMLSALGELI